MKRTYEERVEQFWRGFHRKGTCLLWTGAESPDGYGDLTWYGRRWRSHVLAFVLTYGPVPKGKQVNHVRACPNRLCGEPTHLYAGTQAENTQSCCCAARRSK